MAKTDGKVRALGAIVAVACLAILAPIATAGELDPPGPPAPTMKTLDDVQPGTAIRAADLPLTITTPGLWYLAEDIVTTGSGITVNVGNVTIDLNGFRLEGGTGTGINGPFTDGVTVRNGTVSGWSANGIDVGSGSLVVQVVAENNGGTGIWVRSSSRVLDSTSRSNTGDGIAIGSECHVRGSASTFNGGRGISATNASTIVETSIQGNTGEGIVLFSGNVVSRCTFYNGQSKSIDAFQANLIENNAFSSSAGPVIDVDSDNDVRGNVIRGNGSQQGVAAGAGNRIEGNTVHQVDQGIVLSGADNLVVRNSIRAATTAIDAGTGNIVGDVVTDTTGLNAATNDLVNVAF